MYSTLQAQEIMQNYKKCLLILKSPKQVGV